VSLVVVARHPPESAGWRAMPSCVKEAADTWRTAV
jgi:hypothetical protein